MVAGLSAESRAAPDAVPGRPPLGGAAVLVPAVVGDAATRHRARGRRPADARRRARGGRGRRIPAGFGSRLQEAVDSGTLVAARRRRILVPPPVERRGARGRARRGGAAGPPSPVRGRDRAAVRIEHAETDAAGAAAVPSPSPTTAMRREADARRPTTGPCSPRTWSARRTGAPSNCDCSVVRSRFAASCPTRRNRSTTLLRRLRSVAADAGATADELDAVESLLARVDREAQPLVAAELLVRRMHLRDITGQGFIDVDEMREAVPLGGGRHDEPRVRAGARGARSRRGVGRASRCAGARERRDRGRARDRRPAGAVARARGRFDDGGHRRGCADGPGARARGGRGRPRPRATGGRTCTR